MALPRWYPDEQAKAGPEHLDPAYVAGYDRKAGPESGDDLALLRDLGLDERHTLVGLGAGTGSLALSAAPCCGRVVAVDVSPAMLAVLRDRAERSDVTNLEVIQGGLLSYQHLGEPVDFVYSRDVLHHLPDFWKAVALERMAAMMASGGVLLLRDLVFSREPAETDDGIEAWLAATAARPDMGWTRAELEEHLRQEYSTFSWLLEPMLERAGFAIRCAEYSPNRIYAAYVCAKVSSDVALVAKSGARVLSPCSASPCRRERRAVGVSFRAERGISALPKRRPLRTEIPPASE